MTQVQATLAAEPAPGKTDRSGLVWLQAGLLTGLVLLLYYSILGRLVYDWLHDDNFSHGFFVPLFSGFVLWQNRKRLLAMPARPAWFGGVVIAGSLGLLVVGVLGSELFLSRTSLLFLLAGLVLFFRGWSAFGAVFFPWCFLFLMIPIPAIIFNQITFPLQLFASKLATALLPVFNVPVLRQGNVIQLPAMQLEVAEACSGIRSLMSLGTLAIIYGYFLESKLRPRILLAISAVPIAVAANALRIVGTGLMVQYWDPDKALGFFHEFSGWVIFVISLLMLFAVHSAVRLLFRAKAERTS